MSSEEKPSPPQLPRVALFIETSVGPGRDMLCGVARYVRESGPWALHMEMRSDMFVEGWHPKWLNDWRGSGIIARLETDSLVEAIKRTGLPAVDVLGDAQQPFPARPRRRCRHRTDGRRASDRCRGFKQFGFCRAHEPWSDRRLAAFKDEVAKEGFECSVLNVENIYEIEEAFTSFIDHAAQWIAKQPKPLGLMLCNDTFGPPITQACRQAGVAVPEEVAIIGVDNDEPICAICDPPLTSVDSEPRRSRLPGCRPSRPRMMADKDFFRRPRCWSRPRALSCANRPRCRPSKTPSSLSHCG